MFWIKYMIQCCFIWFPSIKLFLLWARITIVRWKIFNLLNYKSLFGLYKSEPISLFLRFFINDFDHFYLQKYSRWLKVRSCWSLIYQKFIEKLCNFHLNEVKSHYFFLSKSSEWKCLTWLALLCSITRKGTLKLLLSIILLTFFM